LSGLNKSNSAQSLDRSNELEDFEDEDEYEEDELNDFLYTNGNNYGELTGLSDENTFGTRDQKNIVINQIMISYYNS
jgi:hypothetical protein